MEYPGLIKIAMHGGPPCDPDSRDWTIGTTEGEGGLADPVARWIDEVMPGHVDTAGGPVLRQACMYSMTPDEDFVIDFLGGEEFGRDVVVGAGFSGHGFKMGPAIGRILAAMVVDGLRREVAAGFAGLRSALWRSGGVGGEASGAAKLGGASALPGGDGAGSRFWRRRRCEGYVGKELPTSSRRSASFV
uniref:FAD dependent oxidoreductase domain-containing protein n=1 Tax=Aegilops tauschii subsp. strangulata TaxID=200361 RepID=A0A453L625_AEGTS